MVKYKVLISESAAKSLKKIPKKDVPKIADAIQALATNPLPSGIRKLSGEENTFRQRVGTYRIIYEIKNKTLIILVLKIGHRKDIYRNL